MFEPFRLKIIVLLTVVIASAGLASDDAGGLVRRTIDATSWVNRSHTTGTYMVSDNGVDRNPDIVRKFESFVDGQRIRLVRENRRKQPDEQLMLLEIVSVPGRRLMWTKDGTVSYTESNAVIRQAMAVDRALPDAGYILDAVFSLDDEYPVFDVKTALDTGSVLDNVTQEPVGGLQCEKVTIKGDTWTFDLWIAPERGFNLAKYRFQCEPKPKSHRYHADFTVENISHRKLPDGRWVINGGRYKYLSSSQSGKKMKEWDIKRDVIDLEPDFSATKAFVDPPIPNGTTIGVERTDDQGKRVSDSLMYVWKDGKIVPAFDPDTIERLRKSVDEAKQGR